MPLTQRAPLVSVVIPTFNRADVIAQSIDSVLAQSYRRIEIVVVDDGSTDATRAVLKSYGNNIRAIHQPNGGLAQARNAGHAAATGELIAWLDSDDLCEPERIGLQVEYLLAHPTVVLVSSNFSAFNVDHVSHPGYGSTYYSRVRDQGYERLYGGSEPFVPTAAPWNAGLAGLNTCRGPVYEHIVWGNFVHPPTVMFRRDALSTVGLLDPAVAYAEDWEFFVRLSRIGQFAHIERDLLRYRLHDGQMSALSRARNLRAQIRVRKLTLVRDPGWYNMHASRVRRQLARWYAALAEAEGTESLVAGVKNLARSLSYGIDLRQQLRAAVFTLLPKWLIHAHRARRAQRIAVP